MATLTRCVGFPAQLSESIQMPTCDLNHRVCHGSRGKYKLEARPVGFDRYTIGSRPVAIPPERSPETGELHDLGQRVPPGCTTRPRLIAIAPASPGYARAKRTLDIISSLIALIVSAPLFLLIGLGVLCTSGRPIFYRQTRLGLGGRPFALYKFRTMAPDAEAVLQRARERQIAINPTNPIVKPEEAGNLITPFGHFLRTTSLDELPQFVNVLKGDMSLVGPRPPLPEEAATYTTRQAQRLSVMPGLTCIWQVSGRSTIGFDRWIEMDLEYLQRRSFWFDLQILLRTFPAVLSRRGAR